MSMSATGIAEPAKVYTVPETAARLRISRGAAYAAVRSGEIRSLRIGRSVRIPASVIAELLWEPG